MVVVSRALLVGAFVEMSDGVVVPGPVEAVGELIGRGLLRE